MNMQCASSRVLFSKIVNELMDMCQAGDHSK